MKCKGASNNSKLKIIGIVIALIVVIVIVLYFTVFSKLMNKKEDENKDEEVSQSIQNEEDVAQTVDPVDIIDVNSTSRPFAVSVNNTPVAVKVQEGLNKAFLVYELPTEGATSRLLALFKDVDDVTIGTIRSARHNFIDYALESNGIFVAYGWSHYAEDDLKKGSINYIQGLSDSPFWRNNPEGLASEHTAYTSIAKLKETASAKNFNLNSDSADKTVLLNYSGSDVDLSQNENVQKANSVSIPYGTGFKTEFKYNKETGMYDRYENGSANIDHSTKEQFNAKNIIVQKITYNVCDDGYYWDLHTTGSGTGYYITNGYAVPINWSKSSRNDKTKYTYSDGTEIEVSDGRTYIEVQTTSQNLTINE